jgi:hypothetical protein
MIVNTKTVKIVTIEFTEEEFRLFRDGLGTTSEYSRIEAGMTQEQSQFFGQLFDDFPSTTLF